MKFVHPFLAALFLLGFTAAAQADDAVQAADAQIPLETPAPGAAIEPQVTPAGGCEVAATPAIAGLGGQEPIPQQGMACGS